MRGEARQRAEVPRPVLLLCPPISPLPLPQRAAEDANGRAHLLMTTQLADFSELRR